MNCIDGGSASNYVAVSVERLLKASQQRGDGLHEQLTQEHDTVYCHKNCVSTYTSKTHIKRYLSKTSNSESEPSRKRNRRSEATFSFREHCLICGERCISEHDGKNPGRWRRVVQCRTAGGGSKLKSFKDTILETCDQRDDEWSQEVKLRIQGAVSDLHAADAQYHKDCMSTFRGHRNVQATLNVDTDKVDIDEALELVVDDLQSEPSRIWNSLEVDDLYSSYKGMLLSQRQLVKSLSDRFGQDLLILSGICVASILVFKNKTAGHLKLVANDDDDDVDLALVKVAKKIVKELKQLMHDQRKYDTRITLQDAISASSPTLLSLMSIISPKLDSTLSAAMIGNIVTNVVSSDCAGNSRA